MNPFLNLIDYHEEKIITGLTDELKALFITKQSKKRNVLVLINSLYEANNLYKKISNYNDNTYLFPMDDFLTSEALAISPELKYQRLETLNSLIYNKEKSIVVTNLMGYLRFLPSKKLFKENKLILKKENDINIEVLREMLFNLGYIKETIVNKTGELAIRGFVVDIYPVNHEYPYRVEFWGDTIDSIKTFDVDTQRTIKEVEEVEIFSNTEFITSKQAPFEEKFQRNLDNFTKPENITNYLDNPFIIFINSNDLKVGNELLLNEIIEYKISYPEYKNTSFMNDFEKISNSNLVINDFESDVISEVDYKSKDLIPFKTDKNIINNELNKLLKQKKTVYICVKNRYSANKIIDYLENDNIIFTSPNELIGNKVNLIVFNLTKGFEFSSFIVYSEREIFGFKESSVPYRTRFKLGSRIRDITKLNVGDYIVHVSHGIGIYSGIKTLTKNGLRKDYLVLDYQGTDKLYVPVEKIDLISKYSAGEGIKPRLNKLGTTEWEKTKLRIKKKIEGIADDLLNLYKEREKTIGFEFDEDTKEQYEFEDDFYYEITVDQAKVIKEIKQDMENKKPMDRLLCGDVGFGKTEVAFRAVFKAIMSGKQAALLCPTTILSKQHFENAIERFARFGVNVELLNRFVTGKKLSSIKDKIKKGQIDFVIGTHKLLGKDINFKNLGFLVIDEEQRFGVKHKEKIKEYKNNIDVLTLSATPIPRTLQMSIAGIRNLSLIETPPVNRHPVQTYVVAENKNLVKDAIYKELSRNGQVFLLYNHVDSIESKAKEINRLVPDARIIYAHGRMGKNELEDIMLKFTNKEYDVLICTTIIETGIDIPNVNTLLIMEADKFGLSQLYQIRGRVGRSNKIAYCYLMYDNRKILSEIANKRLSVIKDFTELGSGFAIAMRDLSIRGAGDILGSEQAGFIDSVGVELFLNMLNEEVEIKKGNILPKPEELPNPLVDVETTIDDKYVSDEELKIEIHKKINEINSYEELKLIKTELEDRFGKLPESINIYMYEEWFEKLARKLNINRVKQTKNSIEIILPKELSNNIDGQKLFFDITELSRMIRLSMKFNSLIITLDTVKLDKHFIFYLIELMKIIEKSKKQG
jgi:transcription-repair coupling factor (mfd)